MLILGLLVATCNQKKPMQRGCGVRSCLLLVQKENYLLELARYIVLNPVRARMVREAKDWPWSSYRKTAGILADDSLLTTEWLLSIFSKKRGTAQKKYIEFVNQGENQPSPWESLQNQVF